MRCLRLLFSKVDPRRYTRFIRIHETFAVPSWRRARWLFFFGNQAVSASCALQPAHFPLGLGICRNNSSFASACPMLSASFQRTPRCTTLRTRCISTPVSCLTSVPQAPLNPSKCLFRFLPPCCGRLAALWILSVRLFILAARNAPFRLQASSQGSSTFIYTFIIERHS